MTKQFLTSVLFLAVFAAPSFAASPSDRYQAALDLLTQAQAEAEFAYSISGNPNDSALAVVQTITFARQAAQDAVDAKGGAARKDALAAASTAYLGYQMAVVFVQSETNSDADIYWLSAAADAYQAALDINKNVDR